MARRQIPKVTTPRRTPREAAANLKRAKSEQSAPKKSGGKGSRQKGDRFERECVNAFLAGGIFAERVPLSGAVGGSFGADIQVTLREKVQKFECKMRKRAWSDLYKWIVGNYALLIRTNGNEGLVVFRLADFIDMHKSEW